MKSKKLISFLCAAALTVSSFAGLAVTASAEGETAEKTAVTLQKNYTFDDAENTPEYVVDTGTTGVMDAEVVAPAGDAATGHATPALAVTGKDRNDTDVVAASRSSFTSIDLSSLTDKAERVVVEFDSYVKKGARAVILLNDTKKKNAGDPSGLFGMGEWKGGDGNLGSGGWYHSTVDVTFSEGNAYVSYSVTDAEGNPYTVVDGEGAAQPHQPASQEDKKVSGVEALNYLTITVWDNGDTVYLDNLKVSTGGTYSYTPDPVDAETPSTVEGSGVLNDILPASVLADQENMLLDTGWTKSVGDESKVLNHSTAKKAVTTAIDNRGRDAIKGVGVAGKSVYAMFDVLVGVNSKFVLESGGGNKVGPDLTLTSDKVGEITVGATNKTALSGKIVHDTWYRVVAEYPQVEEESQKRTKDVVYTIYRIDKNDPTQLESVAAKFTEVGGRNLAGVTSGTFQSLDGFTLSVVGDAYIDNYATFIAEAGVIADPYELPDVTITGYTKETKTAALNVTNAENIDKSQEALGKNILIHSSYDANNALTKVTTYPVTLQVSGNDVTGTVSLDANDAVYAGDKLMVWNSLKGMRPLGAAREISSGEASDVQAQTLTAAGVTVTAAGISQEPKIGETLTATVNVGSTGLDADTNFDYQWYKDGTAIEGATTKTLDTTGKDAGSYTVKATVKGNAAYTGDVTSAAVAVAAADPVVTGQTVAVAQDFTGATVTVGSEAVAAGANKTNVAAATVITITPTENTKKVTSVTYNNGEADVTTGVTLVDADGTATITVSNFDITIKSVVLADKAAAPTKTDVTAATAEITKNGTTLTASVKDVTPSDAASAFTTYAWSRSTTADGTYAPVAGLSNTLTAETGYFYKVAISIPASNETYNTYTATSDPVEVPVPTYTISGTVGTGVTAVAVTDGNDFNENATIEDGSYSITVPAGTYTITPTVNADLYEVSPASHTNVEVTDNNITGKNFTTLKKYPADAKPSITADGGAIKVGAELSANLTALNLGEAAETATVTWYFKGTASDAEFAAVPANDSKISEGKFTPDAEGTVKVKVEATGYVAGGVESDPATVGPNVNYVNVVITANGIASATLTNAADANKTYPASAGTGANADKLVAAVPVNATYNVTATPASNYAAPITYTGTTKSGDDEQIAVAENATDDVAVTITATRVYAVTTETGTFAESVTAVPANTKVVFTPTAAVAGKKIKGVEVQDPANSDVKIDDATAEGDGTYSYTVTNQAVKFTTIYVDQTATVKVTEATLVGGTVTATANTGAEGAATAVTTEGIAVPVGKTITAKAVPAEGYKVASITIKTAATENFTGDVTDTTNGATTTYEIVAGDDAQTYTVTATFVKVDYTITNFTDDQTAPSTVKVTKVGETVYSREEPTANSGDTVTIKVAAAAGKQLQANSLKVVAAGKTIGQDDYAGETLTPDPSDNTTYTFTMPAANVSIQAIFEAITHALTLPADETVTSDAADATKVAEGATVNLTITPPKGKKIKTLTVGDTEYEKADEAAATKYVTNASTGVSTTSFTMNDDTTVAVEYEVVYDTATVDPELLTYIVHSDAVKSNNLTDLTNEGSVDSDFTLKSAGNLQETTKTVMTGYQQSVFTSKYSSAGTFRTNSAAAYAVFDLADKVDDNVTKVTIKFDTESALAKGAGISAYFATQIDKWTAASTWTDINGVNANNAESIKVYAPSGNYAYGPSVGTAAANTTSQISFVIDNPALTLLKSCNNKLGIVLVANYDAGGLITLKNVVLEVESTDADMANYTVNAVDGEGNVLQEAIVTGTHAKNDEVEAIGLPKAVKYNDAYYVINETAEQAGFTTTFKMGDTDTTKTVEYTLDSTIKYYTEAENTGRLASTNWNPVKGYASGKASASYASSYLFVGAPAGATNGNTMETFAAGTYEFEVSVVDASHGRNVLLRNAASTSDDSILLTISGKGVKKETFTLTDATKLHITGKNAGTKTGQSDDIDYFIIREVTE